MFPALAALGGLSTGGGIMSSLSQAAPFVSAVSGLLGGLGGSSGPKAADQFGWQAAENRSFAQNQILWRVNDAKQAGLRPLAALGINPSGSNISMVGQDPRDNILTKLGAAGQDVSRAMSAFQSKEERGLVRAQQLQQVERGSLENELLRSQIARERAQLAPPIAQVPSPVGYDDGKMISMWTTVMTPGGPKKIPSPEYAQIMENYFPEALQYMGADFAPGSANKKRPDDRGWLSRFINRTFK